ncbi:MAG: hypothetical protein PHE83_14985 [Opitutaceae bacterium]|nr:hypothetical protein [Opitutaceae bacterium]
MKRLLIGILIVGLVAPPAYASGIPTIDAPNLAALVEQIKQFDSQIQWMSSVVGAARDQIQMLQKVSNGIYNLKRVIGGGVQGIMGSAADAVGLKDVFAVGKELQTTFTDGMNLYRDVRELPVEAQQQWENIGLSVKDLKQYLSTGVVYDVFQGMDLPDWERTFKHPIDAFEHGAVGRAVDCSDAYLDTTQMRQAYLEKIQNLTPDERARLSGDIGVNSALLNLGDWGKGMERRLAKAVDYQVVADKIITKKPDDPNAGTAENLVDQALRQNALAAAQLKAQADAMRFQTEAQEHGNLQLGQQTVIMRERQARQQREETADAMVAGP